MNPCLKCNTVIENNAIQCLLCEKWTHLICVNFSGEDDDSFFLCEKCDIEIKSRVPLEITIGSDQKEQSVASKNIQNEQTVTCNNIEKAIIPQETEEMGISDNSTRENVEETIEQEIEESVASESIEQMIILEDATIESDKKQASLKIKFSKVNGNEYKIKNHISDSNNNDPQIYINSDNSGKPIQNENNNKPVKRKVKNTSESKKKTLSQQSQLGEIYFSTHIKSEVNNELNYTVYSCQTCVKFKPTIHLLKAKKHACKHEEMAKSVGKIKPKKANKVKEAKWACFSCDFKAIKKIDLIKHSKEDHPTDPSEVCSNCGQSFIDHKTLKRHIKQVHLKIKNTSCDQCDYKCRDSYDLNRHIKRNHTPKVKLPNNVIKSSVVNINKDKESETVNKIKEYIYQCQHCDKSFSDKIKLNRHVRGHNGDNLPTCEVCNKCFRDNFNLNKHMRSHNKITTKYACNFCSKTFARENKFLNHLNKEHKKYINVDNVDKETANDPIHNIITVEQENIQEPNHDEFMVNDNSITDELQNNILKINHDEFLVNDNTITDNVHKGILELNHNEFIVNDKNSNIPSLSLGDTITLYLDVNESGKGIPFDIPHSSNESMSNIDINKSSQNALFNNPDLMLTDEFQLFNVTTLDETQIEEDCNNVNNIVCEFCNNVFAQNYNLLRHIQEIHNQDIIKCEKCQVTFHGKDAFLAHRPCKWWICTSCNKVFGKYTSYVNHEKNIHGH